MKAARRPAPEPAPLANVDAERKLLGFFLTPEARGHEAEVLALTPDLFSKLEHCAVLAAMREVAEAGEPLDPVTVDAVLRTLPSPPSRALVLELVEAAGPTPGPYRDILEACSRRRRLDSTLRATLNRLGDAGADAATVEAELAAALVSSPPRGTRFRLLDEASVAALPRPQFLVDDVLVAQALTVVYGPPATAKTFLTLDLTLAIVTGQRWHGRAVRPGTVLYVAAEGGLGLRQRLRAWTEHHGWTGQLGSRFQVLIEPVNLLMPAEVDALIAVAKTLPELPCAVVFDTMARCTVGGDENSARDMGLAVAALDRIRTALSCAVLVDHHTTKQADTERGSSALRGAADCMLALAKDGDLVTISCAKAKDTEEFADIVLALKPVADSCVLVPTTAIPRDTTRPTGGTLKALSILVDLFDDDGATYTAWLAAFAGTDDRKKVHNTFLRARKDLVAGKWVNPPKADTKKKGARYVATTKGIDAVRFIRSTKGSWAHREPDQGLGSFGCTPRRGAPNGPNGPDPQSRASAPDQAEQPRRAELCSCGEPATAWSADDGWCDACWERRCVS
jgi:hypothetical protein